MILGGAILSQAARREIFFFHAIKKIKPKPMPVCATKASLDCPSRPIFCVFHACFKFLCFYAAGYYYNILFVCLFVWSIKTAQPQRFVV